MRPNRDIEPVLDAWLAPGPTEMPDDLFRDVLRRIEHVPQRRFAWAPRRFTSMFSAFKLATAAVVAGLVIGVVSVAPLQAPAEVAQSPSPSLSPSPSVRPTAIPPTPAELQGDWLGPPKIVGGLVSNGTLSSWTISGERLDIGYGGTFLRSRVIWDGPDRLRIISPSNDTALPCQPGAEGSYTWQLSAGGTRLSLQAVEDQCAPRAAFLAGEWSKGRCEITGRACMGLLEAGRYEAGVFDPRGGPDDPPRAVMGAFAFEVPEGWAVAAENLSSYELTTADGFASVLVGRSEGQDNIRIMAQPVAVLPYEAPECAWRLDPGAERSVDGLADWLTSHALLAVSEADPVTIDGHPARVFDVDLRTPDVPGSSCFGMPVLPLFANGAAFGPDGTWFADMVYGDHWLAEIGGGPTDPVRIILVDLDGDPTVILFDTAAPEDQAAFVEQAMPVVESFEFPT